MSVSTTYSVPISNLKDSYKTYEDLVSDVARLEGQKVDKRGGVLTYNISYGFLEAITIISFYTYKQNVFGKGRHVRKFKIMIDDTVEAGVKAFNEMKNIHAFI